MTRAAQRSAHAGITYRSRVNAIEAAEAAAGAAGSTAGGSATALRCRAAAALGPRQPATRDPPSPDLQVLNELAGDNSLERFRIEYEKLYRSLKKSHGAAGR